MDSKILLVKTITLLYKESTLSNKIQDYTRDLAKRIADTVKSVQVSVVDLDPRTEILESLKDIIHKIVADKTSSINLDILKQSLMIAVRGESFLYEGFTMMINNQETEDVTNQTIASLKKELDIYLKQHDIMRILKEHTQKAHFETQNIEDWRAFRDGVINDLESVGNFTVKNEVHPALNMSVDFKNEDEVEHALTRGVANQSHSGTLKTGLQGLNEMLGAPNGYRRGEYILYSAPQYSFKSGFALLSVMWALMYNKPQLIDETKKPLIMFFSFENTVQSNIVLMYKYLKENELKHKIEINVGDYDPTTALGQGNLTKASAYIKEKLQVNGFHFKMESYNSTIFTTQDLLDRLNELQAEGYEVVFCIADYLAVLNKKGLTMGAHGDELRDQHRRVRSYTNPRGITFMTPHQMSQEAIQELRNGKKDELVKLVANKNYYDGCKRIAQEPDLELYLYVVDVGDVKYLEIGRGKHRDINDTDPKKLYTVYKFEEYGTIPPDVNDVNRSRRKVGGGSTSGEDDEWFEIS